ncbi:MAG: hypothetical protein ACRDLL_07735 [Solirubrobacterales bacterium]
MARPRLSNGFVAPIALCCGLGLLLCSFANTLARETLDPSSLLYWGGILLISLPIFWRLTSRDASPGERLVLVCLLGLSLYGVKVVRDAPLFTFSDELVHAFNADQIASHHHLFRSNPILPVTPRYPGLEGATSALMTITGISSYWAGIVVVGIARLSLTIALFLLFARVGGSARTAGLAVAIYAGNFNFLYWGAQFSYESLSLPLFAVVLMAVAERGAAPRERARDWAVPIVLGIAAIVVTHHLTSYAVAVFLAALAVAYWLVRRDWSWPNPWRFAVLAALLATAWLLLVANSTFGYLGPVIGEAFEAIFNTASGEAPPRALFEGKGSSASLPPTPFLARAIALLAVGLLAAATPFGLMRFWRRYRRQPFALVFALAALGFFATLLLRLAPAAWETGNRLSEFLFIGLAFVAALAGLQNWRPRNRPWIGRAALTAALGVLVVGGAIAGWPWDLQLASPIRASADGGTISSPPLALGEWAEHNVAEGERFAASTADARTLMNPGERTALAGKTPDIQDMLEETAFSGWELPLLRRENLRYVVTDRREISFDGTRGYSFAIDGADEALLPLVSVTKFAELPGATRIYSSGDISIYDLGERP